MENFIFCAVFIPSGTAMKKDKSKFYKTSFAICEKLLMYPRYLWGIIISDEKYLRLTSFFLFMMTDN